jgi:hemolysin III
MTMGSRHGSEKYIGEEIANSITHGVGWAFSIAALVLLVVFSSIDGDPWLIVSCSIYGAGLVFLFAGSTMYHSIQHRKAKKILKIIDHSAIFFLIAATYTPYTLTVIRGPLGWVLFGIVWSGFILGTLFKVFFAGKMKWLSVLIYISLGWCVIFAIKPLINALSLNGLFFLLAGGIAYSLGALIYSKKGVRYSHAVWHIYVLFGAFFHFCSVFFHLIPEN